MAIDQFTRASGNGKNLNIIEEWEQKLNTQLNSTPIELVPDFVSKKFGYGLHAGIGAGIFTGSLGEHFSPTFNFIYGFDFAYENWVAFLNGTLAGDRITKDYIYDEAWLKRQHANVTIVDLSIGYTLKNSRKLKLSPFAGLGITELSTKNTTSANKSLTLTDYNFILGLNADHKLRTLFNLTTHAFRTRKEKSETSVRMRFYVTRANYFKDLNGFSINLTVGVCGFGNLIRLN
jgi:hypothetical protein